MPHLQGASREEVVLFPPSLDDYIAADNPVRFVDVFVDQLDLQAIGFQHSVAAVEGRPAYPPAALLKLYIYGRFASTAYAPVGVSPGPLARGQVSAKASGMWK